LQGIITLFAHSLIGEIKIMEGNWNLVTISVGNAIVSLVSEIFVNLHQLIHVVVVKLVVKTVSVQVNALVVKIAS